MTIYKGGLRMLVDYCKQVVEKYFTKEGVQIEKVSYPVSSRFYAVCF